MLCTLASDMLRFWATFPLRSRSLRSMIGCGTHGTCSRMLFLTEVSSKVSSHKGFSFNEDAVGSVRLINAVYCRLTMPMGLAMTFTIYTGLISSI